MKSTGPLDPMGDVSIPFNRIVLNPNDGFDLGVMAPTTLVKIYSSESIDAFESGEGYFADGQLLQENSCKIGTAIMGMRTLQSIHMPKQIRLHMVDNRLLVSPL